MRVSVSRVPLPARQRGFALVVGVLLLLVLTLLSLTAIRSTQLELQMATSVTRLEQTIEAADFGRGLGREVIAAKSKEGVIRQTATSLGVVPNFVRTTSANKCSSGFVGASQTGDEVLEQDVINGHLTNFARGGDCGHSDKTTPVDLDRCFGPRLQQINTLPFKIDLPLETNYCLVNPELPVTVGMTTLQLSVGRTIGSDATGTDEIDGMMAIVSSAESDGAQTKAVSYATTKTTRNTN
jgi:hypothetical protein